MSDSTTQVQLKAAMEPLLALLSRFDQKLIVIDDKVTRAVISFIEIRHHLDSLKEELRGECEDLLDSPGKNGDFAACSELPATVEQVITRRKLNSLEVDQKIVQNEQSPYLGDELAHDLDRDDTPTSMNHRVKVAKFFGVTRTRCIQACILGLLLKILFF